MESRKAGKAAKRRQTGRIVLIRDHRVLPRPVRSNAASKRPMQAVGCGA
jgi:hypothetical protein